jgi:hypothetical protein
VQELATDLHGFSRIPLEASSLNYRFASVIIERFSVDEIAFYGDGREDSRFLASPGMTLRIWLKARS